MLNAKNHTLRTRLTVSASALVFAACFGGVANAATVTLGSGNSPYNLQSDSVSDTVVVPTGATALLSAGYVSPPSGGYLLYSTSVNNISADNYCVFSNCATNLDKIVVQSGATLQVDGPWGWQVYQSFFNASGTVEILSGKTIDMVGTNSFLGNLVVDSGATLTYGESWSTSQFILGANTNISLASGSTLNLYMPGTFTAAMGGTLTGTGTLKLNTGTLLINGANSAANPFTGTLTVAPGATLVVGDGSHATAVFGDPGHPTAQTLAIVGNTSGSPVLRGLGTIAANVVNQAGVVQPGYGSSLGNLTVQTYTQDNVGTLKVEVSPTSVSGLHVLGNATLGGTLNVAIDAGNYTTKIYNIVQVDGTMTGSFKSITTSSAVAGAIAAVTKTSNGYQVVTEVVQGKAATAPIVVGHLVDVNRNNNTYFINALYDQIAIDSPRAGQQIGRNKYAWIEGFGEHSTLKRSDVGYHETTAGVRGGAEYRDEKNRIVGVAASYSAGDLKALGASTASMNTWHVAMYGGANVQNFRLDGALFYNGYSSDTKRSFDTSGTAATSPSGFSYGGSVQVSLPLYRGLVTPYIRGILSRQHLDGSAETGSPLLNLRYNAINGDYFLGDFGFKIDPFRSTPDSKTKLLLTVAVEHDFSALGEKVTGTFPVDQGQAWSAYWRGDSENTAVVGIDLARKVTDSLEISGRVNTRFTLYQTGGELALNAKYRF